MHAVRFSVLSCVLAGALAGCAGASSSEFFEPIPTGSDLSKTEPGTTKNKSPGSSSSTTTPSTSPTPHPGGAGSSDPGHPGPKQGPAADPAGDPPGNPDAPPPPGDTCTEEAEGNDSPDEATAFTSCIGGHVGLNHDVDFLKITVPADARRMFIDHSEPDGRVQYRVFKEGDLTSVLLDADVFLDNTPELRVSPGATYVFRVSSSMFNTGEGRERGYEIKVTFSNQR